MSLAFGDGPRKPELASYRAIDIRCEDCGRSKRMHPGDIASVIRTGTHTLVGLHNKLHCSVCRDRGGLGKNVSLIPITRSIRVDAR